MILYTGGWTVKETAGLDKGEEEVKGQFSIDGGCSSETRNSRGKHWFEGHRASD